MNSNIFILKNLSCIKIGYNNNNNNKVRECLRKIHSGLVERQENVIGTVRYLEVVWRYVEIFYSLKATLEERIANASYVCNFLRIWRLWVFATKDLKLKENFISRETFADVCLSCHHVVLFIKASRDFAPNHPIEFQRLGSDACEEFFSSNGSFVVNKHNYTITDMFRNLTNMQFLQEMFADAEGPENPKKHRKGENIWRKGHVADTANAPDLSAFPSDSEISDSWEKGLKQCHGDLRSAGIVPEDDDVNNLKNRWFFKPHLITATTEARIAEQMWKNDDENESSEIMETNEEQDDQVNIANSESSHVENYPELAVHLRYVLDDDADTTGLSENETHAPEIEKNVKLTVSVPDIGEVHKSTIFAMLNTSPDGLSKDRLRRVKSKHTITSVSSVSLSDEIGLFDDIALCLTKQKRKVVKLARIIRMRNKAKSYVEFKNPISLDSQAKYPNLVLSVAFYERNLNGEYVYDVSHSVIYTASLNQVIMKVALTLNENGLYSINQADEKSLEEFKKNIIKKKSLSKASRNSMKGKKSSSGKSSVETDGEGRIVIVTAPTTADDLGQDDNIRRSQRSRRVVLYEAD